jgi:hypothetical protein
MARTYVFRLTSEGVRELEAQFKTAGDAGERMFENLKSRVPGLGSVLEQQNRRLDETRRRLEDGAQSSNVFTGSLERSGESIGRLIGRYASWAIIIGTVTRAWREAAENNTEIARANAELQRSWQEMASSASTALTPLVGLTADILSNVAGIFKEVNDRDWAGAWRKFQEGVSVDNPQVRELLAQQRTTRSSGVTIPISPPPGTFPDSITVTPAQRSGLADIMAGDPVLAEGFQVQAGWLDAFSKTRAEAQAWKDKMVQAGRDAANASTVAARQRR